MSISYACLLGTRLTRQSSRYSPPVKSAVAAHRLVCAPYSADLKNRAIHTATSTHTATVRMLHINTQAHAHTPRRHTQKAADMVCVQVT